MGAVPFPGMPGVSVERDVACVVRDGTILRADVYRPAGEGPFPVLLQRLPYDKTAAESNFGYAHPSWYAAHGYLVVIQDCRGSGSSDGDWYPFTREAEDGYDAVEWAAALPGSNGKVGTYGFSYPGYLQLQTACLRPPSLVAISPGFTGAQAYEGWSYDQGALRLGFVAYWAMLLELAVHRRAGNEAAFNAQFAALGQMPGLNWVLPLAQIPSLENAQYWHDWLAHPSYDDYWRPLSIDADYSRIAVPVLHTGGWYDVFVRGTVDNFVGLTEGAGDAAARASQKLLVGPWHHGPWRPLLGAGPEGGANVFDEWQLRWFDQQLKGAETGVLDAPVTAYVLDERWRDFAAWPPPQSQPTPWYLHSGGRANTATGDGVLSQTPPGEELPDVFVYDPLAPAPSLGGHSCCLEAVSPEGPACQCAYEALRGVLCYTTEPLSADLLLAGEVTLTLHAATSAPDTDWTCRLCIVDETGTSTNLLEGIVRARYRESTSTPTPIRPHEVYAYTIRLGPIAARIRAGRRLRLDVSSSDFPQWDRNLNTGGVAGVEGPLAAMVATQVVLHDRERPSQVSLPVVA